MFQSDLVYFADLYDKFNVIKLDLQEELSLVKIKSFISAFIFFNKCNLGLKKFYQLLNQITDQ